MITIARIDGIARQWQGSELHAKLVQAFPEGQCGSDGHMFSARVDVKDDRYSQIMDILRSSGLRQWTDMSRTPIRSEEYTLSYDRSYNPSDLDACDFLELTAQGEEVVMKGEPRLEGRTVAKIAEPGKADICMLGICSCTYIIVQRARDALEAANLKGLKFLPVEKTYESIDYDLSDEEDTWWELESDIELPPVAPSMTLETRDGRPFRGDFTEGCIRREGFYTHPELHYRRADLERIGPFDAARTYEHFHPRGPAPLSRAFVVSKRFYDICKENNIKTRFVPVRIDDL